MLEQKEIEQIKSIVELYENGIDFEMLCEFIVKSYDHFVRTSADNANSKTINEWNEHFKFKLKINKINEKQILLIFNYLIEYHKEFTKERDHLGEMIFNVVAKPLFDYRKLYFEAVIYKTLELR